MTSSGYRRRASAYAHHLQLKAYQQRNTFSQGTQSSPYVAVALCQKQETTCMLTVYHKPTTAVLLVLSQPEPGKANSWVHVQAQGKTAFGQTNKGLLVTRTDIAALHKHVMLVGWHGVA